MSLSIQKLSASHSAKNVLITFINANNVNVFEPISKPTQDKNTDLLSSKYYLYNKRHYSIAEIPPPYCSVCNQFMTTTQCNRMIQPKSCPLF